MSLLITSFTFISGLIILIAGAELFIGYASKLGAKLGISELLIGITLNALGTSIPEIFVSVSSILNNAPSIALGNSIGSNISNIGIIYGLSLFWLSTTLISINLRNIFILVILICLVSHNVISAKSEGDRELPAALDRKIDFSKEVKPILERSCTNCHARGKDKGGFSIDHVHSFIAGGDSGPAVVKGKGDQSSLAVSYTHLTLPTKRIV